MSALILLWGSALVTQARSIQRTRNPIPVRPDDDRFVGLASELAERFAARAAQHDRDNTFVSENFEAVRASRYTALAVPTALGGLGASMRQVCYAQAALARGCASTALAINMHVYLTLANVYRWKRGDAGPEGLLRRVANEGLLLMSSGASDGLWPTTSATREGDGYRVYGRKLFCSEAPVGDVLVTSAAYDDPQHGRVILVMGIPRSSAGFRVVETWDTLGMRGTASHDVQLDGVFVPETQITGRRPWGQLDAMLRSALFNFSLPVAAVYYGVACSARDEAVHTLTHRAAADGQPLATDALIQRTVGHMDAQLKTAWWALLGALDELGEEFDYPPDDEHLSTCMLAKRSVVLKAQSVVDLAMQAVGGASYFKRSPLERAYRDVRAGSFHPLSPEKTLLYAGRLTLDQPVNQIL
jgi:acyl-CoA dehydrogenase